MLSVVFLSTVIVVAFAQQLDVGCNVTTCFELDANDLTFHCRRVQPVHLSSDDAINVLLLHGFPEWSHHWVPLMQYWSDEQIAVDAVACDLRGYSPDASPDSASDYAYTTLQTDVWAIADALNFDTFHLIGHDHGAVLGWTVAADKSDAVSGRVLSWSALSVPHGDVFSDALYGENAVEQQLINSNYFNQFALEDSATINNDSLSVLFGYGGFANAQSFQRALWWYNGSVGSYFAAPPVVQVTDPQGDGEGLVWAVQQAIPLPASNGSAASTRIGTLSMPTLFVCGSNDAYLLCALPYVEEQESLVESTYEVLNVPCGHDLMTCDGDDDEAAMTVIEKITAHIMAAEEDSSSAMQCATSWSLFCLCVMALYAF